MKHRIPKLKQKEEEKVKDSDNKKCGQGCGNKSCAKATSPSYHIDQWQNIYSELNKTRKSPKYCKYCGSDNIRNSNGYYAHGYCMNCGADLDYCKGTGRNISDYEIK
jgi:hypothetical protein